MPKQIKRTNSPPNTRSNSTTYSSSSFQDSSPTNDDIFRAITDQRKLQSSILDQNKTISNELKAHLDNLTILYHELKTEINDLHN